MTQDPRQPLRFRRSMRLRSKRDFAAPREEGRRAVKGCLIANWLLLPPGAATRIGVVTGRRVGKAIDRTRARRLLRESFRLLQHRVKRPIHLVLVARPSINGKSLAQVQRDFVSLMRQADLLQTD